jgi:hypothetical protein
VDLWIGGDAGCSGCEDLFGVVGRSFSRDEVVKDVCKSRWWEGEV